MKTVTFMGDSLARIKAFPPDVRQDTGFQINNIQHGEVPDEWKPMRAIGIGAREIRTRASGNHYRVIYLMKQKSSVYILHAFQKKTQRTRKSDIDLARKRLQEIGELNG